MDQGRPLSRVTLAAAVAAAPILVACGGGGGSGAGGATSAPVVTVSHPSAPPLPGQTACTVTVTTGIPEPDFNHLPICTPVTYATNPPSGGNHWPVWAAYKIYSTRVPEEMYVHDLEHGAIVLTYRCDGACPDVVSALTSVYDGMEDPLCALTGTSNARAVLTPDPGLATPIAASAWGATYTATCIDLPSLRAFTNAHYGQGREETCADGVDVEAMPVCGDGGGSGGDAGVGDAGDGG